MIASFAHKGLKEFFETNNLRGVKPEWAKRLRVQLDYLNAATSPRDMDLPGYDLHELKGDRKGTWSVKVSGNWRLTFRWEEGNATSVNVEDYH